MYIYISIYLMIFQSVIELVDGQGIQSIMYIVKFKDFISGYFFRYLLLKFNDWMEIFFIIFLVNVCYFWVYNIFNSLDFGYMFVYCFY